MPKPQTLPILYDDLKTVSISLLKKHGYLKPNRHQSGIISWSRSGDKTGSISIRVNTQSENPYLELDYKCNDIPIKYRVQLVSAISNLGKGFIWYFICPHTRKRCQNLYLADTFFYHRSAVKGCMYKVQTYSKQYRELNKKFKLYFQKCEIYNEMNKKYFKKQYAGKPTRKIIKLKRQLQKADNISHNFINRVL